MTDYLLHIFIESCLLSTLAVSLNLLVGYCGLVSLGQMTFYAIGAYATALLAPATPFGYAAAWPAALIMSSIIAALQAAATSNLKGDEFAVATFAMHAVFWTLLMNWVDVTRGPLGITNIPAIQLFWIPIDRPSRFFILAIILLSVSLFVVRRLERRPFGMLMRLVRDDEELAEVYGRNVKLLRRSVWVIAAMIGTSAGVLQASYVGYVNPISFSSMESALLLAVVMIGTPGTFWGPVIGSCVITVFPELLRFVGFPSAQAANIRQILLGLLLVLVIFRVRISNAARPVFLTGHSWRP
jgi:branched-chain amino acid transport system permease protein